MAWMKVETAVARNRKFVKAGPAPSWLWICGLAYCQEGLTDGFIPAEALRFLGVKNAAQLANHLVEAQLWDEVEGGWQIHDYLEHNRSAAQVGEIREERRGAGALGGIKSGEARREAKRKANSGCDLKQPANPSTHRTATATETAQQADSAEPDGSTPPVLVFPTVGRGPRTWGLTDAQIAEWQTAYPGIDVGSECRRALAWVQANRAKTARGMPAFLVRWLNRANDNGHGSSSPPGSRRPAWAQGEGV